MKHPSTLPTDLTRYLDSAFASIDVAAHEAATGNNSLPNPTERQIRANRYKLGRVKVHGLAIGIENARGTFREGVSPDGTAWRNRMAGHYGNFTGTRGADGDAIDVFIGPMPESVDVWVINQRAADGSFDEHKVVLGATSEDQARSIYQHSYDRDWRGLMSIVPATVGQLRWWLKHGNHTIPLAASALPYDPHQQKEVTMDKVLWTADAEPVDKSIARVLYSIRSHDGAAGLILDAMSMADIYADPEIESLVSLDAMVVDVGRMQQKMTTLQRVMEAAGGAVKCVEMAIGEPMKSRGTMQIPVLFTMSDGQTVTVWFHNPDTTPAKLTPMDELVSWKWLINKKDVTIVVAPERGRDLNPREVGRRIMALVETNSPAFTRANTKVAERAAAITSLNGEITGLETELSDLNRKIDAAQELKLAAAVIEVEVTADPVPLDFEFGDMGDPDPEPEDAPPVAADPNKPSTLERARVSALATELDLYELIEKAREATTKSELAAIETQINAQRPLTSRGVEDERKARGDLAVAESVGLGQKEIADFYNGTNLTGINPTGLGQDGLNAEVANRRRSPAAPVNPVAITRTYNDWRADADATLAALVGMGWAITGKKSASGTDQVFKGFPAGQVEVNYAQSNSRDDATGTMTAAVGVFPKQTPIASVSQGIGSPQEVASDINAKVEAWAAAAPAKPAPAIPDSIRRRVTGAIESLALSAKDLDAARSLDKTMGGAGRYEADAFGNIGSGIAQDLAYIEQFRAQSLKNGFDAEGLIASLGGIPAGLEMSASARDWKEATTKPAPVAAPVVVGDENAMTLGTAQGFVASGNGDAQQMADARAVVARWDRVRKTQGKAQAASPIKTLSQRALALADDVAGLGKRAGDYLGAEQQRVFALASKSEYTPLVAAAKRLNSIRTGASLGGLRNPNRQEQNEIDMVVKELKDIAQMAKYVEDGAEPAIPAGYKSTGKYFSGGVEVEGFGKFAAGDRVVDIETQHHGVVEGPTGTGPVLMSSLVKFDNGTAIVRPSDKLEAEQAAAKSFDWLEFGAVMKSNGWIEQGGFRWSRGSEANGDAYNASGTKDDFGAPVIDLEGYENGRPSGFAMISYEGKGASDVVAEIEAAIEEDLARFAPAKATGSFEDQVRAAALAGATITRISGGRGYKGPVGTLRTEDDSHSVSIADTNAMLHVQAIMAEVADDQSWQKPDLAELSRKPAASSIEGWFTGQYNGTDVWTNGHIVDLSGDVPIMAGYEKRIDKKRAAASKPDVGRVVPAMAGVEIEIIAIKGAGMRRSVVFAEAGMQGKGKKVVASAAYVSYFLAKYKGKCVFRAFHPIGAGTAIVVTNASGKKVGVLMPMRDDTISDTDVGAKIAAAGAMRSAAAQPDAPASSTAPTVATAVANDALVAAGFSWGGDNGMPTHYFKTIISDGAKHAFSIRDNRSLGQFKLTEAVSFPGTSVSGASRDLGLATSEAEAIATIDARIKEVEQAESDKAAANAAADAEYEAAQRPENVIAAVDAAYRFADASDDFKLLASMSIADEDYSLFATAKAMDERVHSLGGTVSWRLNADVIMDSVGADTAGITSLFDDDAEVLLDKAEQVNQFKEGDRVINIDTQADMIVTGQRGYNVSCRGQAKPVHANRLKLANGSKPKTVMLDSVSFDAAGELEGTPEGIIRAGGAIIGRAVIMDGDGKAMVFVGEDSTERVMLPGGVRPMWSDDDAGEMIDALFAATIGTPPRSTLTPDEQRAVAQEIGRQLGGSKFKAMTGAKNFVSMGGESAPKGGLQFSLPTGFSQINGKKTGINRVAITLNSNDLYDVDFSGMRGVNSKPIASDTDVGAEDLQALFTRRTGLDTSMGKITSNADTTNRGDIVKTGDPMADYWANSAGASIERDVKAGRVQVVDLTIKPKFRYGMVNRPAMVGALPQGLMYETEPRPALGQPFHDIARNGILVTERELTDAELKNFELARLNDAAGEADLATRVTAELAEYATGYLRYADKGKMDIVTENTMRTLKTIAPNDAVASTEAFVATVVEKMRAGIPAAAPLSYFASYAEAIGKGLFTVGMGEQILRDERLEDGEAERLIEMAQPAAPAPIEPAANPDRALLDAMIAGTTDLEDAGLMAKIEDFAGRYANDAEMMVLVEKAAESYVAYAEKMAA